MYEQKTLSSGRVVEIRPLSWNEFWEMGRMRLEAANDNSEPLYVLSASREARERPLAACVRDWDNIRGEVSLPEVLEMEQLVDKASRNPVLEGNSLPAAAGQTTAGA